MLTKLQLSVKLIKDATNSLINHLREAKNLEKDIVKDLNKAEDNKKIEEVRRKLGI